jgi:hypothetical protein
VNRRSSRPCAFAITLALAALVGCSSTNSQPEASVQAAAVNAALLPEYVNGSGSACGANASTAPGTYVTFSTAGSIKGDTYSIDPEANNGQGLGGQNTWDAIALTPGTPPPTVPPPQGPSPTPTATGPTPTPTGSYYPVYYGTYSLGNPYPTSGCIELVFEPGVKLYNVGDDAAVQGSPNYGTYSSSLATASGNITELNVTISGPANGTGSISLDNGSTGAITITGSKRIYP